ncbi:hypothetical protein BDZ88DRAFT_455395 [Geranomyces variabilis]|nr:hypothetical protein BDZ88DRAFT_455395 [Geranomyces variabilis]
MVLVIWLTTIPDAVTAEKGVFMLLAMHVSKPQKTPIIGQLSSAHAAAHFVRLSRTNRALYVQLLRYSDVYDKALWLFDSLRAHFSINPPAFASSNAPLMDPIERLAQTRDALMFCRPAATWGRGRNMCPSDDLLFSGASAPYNIFPKKAHRLRPPSTRCSARDFQDLHLHIPYRAETWVVEPSSDSEFIFVRRIEICNGSYRRHLYIAVDRHLAVAYECFESPYGDSSNTLRFREHSPFSENLPSLLGCTTISEVFTAFESAFPGFRRKGYIDAEEVSIYGPPDTYVLTPDERERFAVALPKTVPPALREFSDLMGIPQCKRFITAFVPRWFHRAAFRHAERVILCVEAQAKLCSNPEGNRNRAPGSAKLGP